MIPTYGSLFAGVGGFDLGLDAAGYDCRFQVEYDRHCQEVLRRHWPTVPKFGDVRTVNGAHIPAVDVLTFGSPCQDLSVAGKRAGLAGERSGLFHEAMRIVREMRHATANQYPRIVVWENVVGALTSNGGHDFRTVLTEMAESGALVIEWNVLDAQYFGIAQRRRRVFVVAVFDPVAAERCPDPLLPVGESVRGNTQTGGTARETTARTASDCIGTLSVADLTKGQMGHQAIDANLLQVVFGITGHAIGRSDTAGPNGPSHTPEGGPMFTLTSTDRHAVASEVAVRRLTPVECERLMGWPDDHTLLRADGDEQSDAQRYRQIGNGVASPVAEWIGKHLCQLLD